MANRYLRDLTPWPADKPVPANAQFIFYDLGTDDDYRVDAERVGGTGAAGGVVAVRVITANPSPPFVFDELGTYVLGGVEGFYRFKAPAGVAYAVPTGPDDANWHQTAPPVPAGALTVGLPESVYLILDADAALGTYAGMRLYITNLASGLGTVTVDVLGIGAVSYEDAYQFDPSNENLPATPVTMSVENNRVVTRPRVVYDDTQVRGLIATLQAGKVEVWQPGPQLAARVYVVKAANGPGGRAALVQPKADIANSGTVNTAFYNVLAYLPSTDAETAIAANTARIGALEAQFGHVESVFANGTVSVNAALAGRCLRLEPGATGLQVLFPQASLFDTIDMWFWAEGAGLSFAAEPPAPGASDVVRIGYVGGAAFAAEDLVLVRALEGSTWEVRKWGGNSSGGGTEGFGGLGSDLASAGGAVAWNAGGRYQDFRTLTLGENATLQLPTNVPAGGSGFLRVFQNYQGGFTLAAPTGATSNVPAGFGVNATANKLVALVGYVYDGTHFYWNVSRYN